MPNSLTLLSGSAPYTFISAADSHDVGGEGRLDCDVEGDIGGGVVGRFSKENGDEESDGLSLSVICGEWLSSSVGDKPYLDRGLAGLQDMRSASLRKSCTIAYRWLVTLIR